jgi:UDP-GlcNAc:undecaprenyl-phosphate GlcNAc-1-phosphate transferase
MDIFLIRPFYLVVAICAAMGVLSTWVCRELALKYGIVSNPNPIVPQHTRPVAYLGGAGIGLSFGLSFYLFYTLHWPMPLSNAAVPWPFLLSTLGFLVLGLIDDLIILRPRTKLFFQVVVAAHSVLFGLVYPFTRMHLIDCVLSGSWIVIVVNAFNVTDVCDGLVTGLSIIGLFVLAQFNERESFLAIAMAGCCVGFLAFNLPPASIFLGDAGSHLLGFSVAGLTLGMTPKASEWWLRPVQMLLIVMIPLLEVALLVYTRRRKGIAWWRGSPDHMALRLQSANLSKVQTDILIWAGACLLGTAAWSLDSLSHYSRYFTLLTCLIMVLGCFNVLLAHEPK